MRTIIDEKGRLFGRISIIDLIVIAVVAVLALALYVKNTQLDPTGTTTANTTITYEVTARGVPQYVLDSLQVGDVVYDKDQPTVGALGTITQIDVNPGTSIITLDDGTLVSAPWEGYYNLVLTIQGEGLVSDGTYLLNRIYALGVNSARNYQTKYALITVTVSDIL